MKKTILILLSIFLSNVLFSQTILSAGDIAIIQYNSDPNPEVIKFVAFRSMEPGTTINFTDNGWNGTAFRTTEGVHIWTVGSSISCGEVVTVSIPNSNFNLNASGDQIFAYQGTLASPSFIFGINVSTGDWVDSTPASRKTALPSTLIDGTNAVSLSHIDNTKYTGSLSGSKTTILSNICTPGNWTGSNSTVQNFTGTFNSSSTWSSGSWSIAGSDYFEAIISDDYDTTTDGDFETCNCTVNSGNTLTVNSGGTVKVIDDITNNGTILVESGGSVVQVSSDGTNSGTGYTVERASTSQSSYHVFTYWSTPITSATFAAVSPSTHLYYSFDAGSQAWVEGNSGTAMSPGIGYALEGPDTGSYPGVQTSSFTGAPFNNGNISVGLSFSSDGDADNDWNLVGNPYPSAIDADTFLADNSATIGGTIYFWTHNTDEDGTEDNTEDDYAMYNGTGSAAATGGVAPDGNIASAQGFFVQAISSGFLVFNNDMRISGSNTTFFKSEKTKEESFNRDRIWLNLTTDKSFSQILVGFINGATDAVDRMYDGVRFLGKTSLNLYSLIDDIHYGIQGKSSLKEVEVIPIGFSSDVANEFTLSIEKIEGKLDESNIFIEDSFLNVKHNLKDADYVFNTTEPGEFNNRFNLIIETEASVLEVKESVVLEGVTVKNSNNNLIIETLNNTIIQKVLVYDLLGKEILVKENKFSYVQLKSSFLKSNTILIIKTFLETGEVLVNKIYKN
ncbi:hypothetical protein [Polaribacter sp. SA4-12]|uniref:hypothetical protein n=1 Tax=Polaribacter sp. SA4-12 TaxID=1312072 RepID=UPI000B3C8DC2|nr:hypothetical protein [Polaribacter sp. SA4-12]ARV15260.1 hypothetical protein BTO07_08955 [Polaribacter sp. SA4-12]